ncbi:hypothetical protein ABZO31_00175 [Streptomyces sp. HUAS MG47]|uniref:hypothetical protein n=1 Tax=Streptomyces solicamelliae TaxID=3231716 RepID=UPI003877BEBA
MEDEPAAGRGGVEVLVQRGKADAALTLFLDGQPLADLRVEGALLVQFVLDAALHCLALGSTDVGVRGAQPSGEERRSSQGDANWHGKETARGISWSAVVTRQVQQRGAWGV